MERRPGVERLLREAHGAGLRLAIATTTTPENITALLAPDLLALFEKVGAGDTVPNKKPAPDVYVAACLALGVTPADAIAFEDSPMGVQSALAAGLFVVGVPERPDVDLAAAGAHLVLGSLVEVIIEG